MAERAIDLRGLICPLPVLRTRKALMGMTGGARLRVLASDPKTPGDMAQFCAVSGHRLVESGEDAGTFTFLIERA